MKTINRENWLAVINRARGAVCAGGVCLQSGAACVRKCGAVWFCRQGAGRSAARQVRGSLCLLRAGVSAAACLLIFPLTHIPTEQQQRRARAAKQRQWKMGRGANAAFCLRALSLSLSLANKCSVCVCVCAQEPTPERDAAAADRLFAEMRFFCLSRSAPIAFF
jgi:hypothetical protein